MLRGGEGVTAFGDLSYVYSTPRPGTQVQGGEKEGRGGHIWRDVRLISMGQPPFPPKQKPLCTVRVCSWLPHKLTISFLPRPTPSAFSLTLSQLALQLRGWPPGRPYLRTGRAERCGLVACVVRNSAHILYLVKNC